MSEQRNLPSPEDVARVREAAERPLSREEFLAWINTPMGDEEKEEALSLINWFTRHYPTPAERLAYVRRIAPCWKGPPAIEPTKEVDPDAIVGALPKLAEVQAKATAGVFSDRLFDLDENGDWKTKGPGFFDISSFPQQDIELESSVGRFILEGAFITHQSGFDLTYRGTSNRVRCVRAPLAPDEPRVFRTLVRIREKSWDDIAFPRVITYSARRGTAIALLPLRGTTYTLDLFYLREESYLVFESSQPGLTREQFDRLSIRARLLLSYLTGRACIGPAIDTISSARTGEWNEAWWYEGRRVAPHSEAIPVTWRECRQAATLFDSTRSFNALESTTLSKCLETYLREDELIWPIEYLLHFSSMPGEVQGAALCVALESLTTFLERRGLLSPALPLLESGPWESLKANLLALLKAEKDLPQEALNILRERIIGLNRPANTDKLLRGFNILGIPLSPEETRAIEHRNRLLHSGRLLDPAAREKKPAAWRETQQVEMRLFTAVNKLLLKYLGYQGPIIDWGATPMFTGRPVEPVFSCL
jgi:hypothetical protein